MKRFFALPFVLILATCTSVPSAPYGDWESPLYRRHSLVGTVWRTLDAQQVTSEELLDAVGRARFAILGEKHDNPDHHLLQRYVLLELATRAQLAAVNFEMLDSSQQTAVDNLTSADIRSREALKSALKWDEQGWNWQFYGQLLQDSLLANIPVQAANISSDEMMAIYAADDNPAVAGILDEVQLQRLHQEIDESHCGMLPESQFPAMVRVQQARDAQMAQSLRASSNAGLSILIAGNFHGRRDLGVPNYVPTTEGELLSIAFLEVNPEANDLTDYLETFSATLPYDYVWFTPALETQDYCASLRAGNAE